ncbi:SDR family NAD(P)-dependent oxidoreductase [Rhodoferax antarcticus]|uniref:Short chain dehydrogenase family protein n=1 Tax=Rhodoferax antarcticus ANT.BR TaxID=1111071 RepID=A0A1Q8YJ10_9BURK|nr:SDR family NAD(P)-dependent oxidoreductase [Rhodoferax antarcticus]APW47811.1 C-factor [Rhodoferax antarcticus]OLP08038.1 short chain dehydrogenase family protein [Rhodoferax antarcticus ANT.BR]
MQNTDLKPFCLVIGASGGLGAALLARLQADPRYAVTLGLSRRSTPALDLLDEASIAAAAQHLSTLLAEQAGVLRLIVDATGMLHTPTQQPEKSWAQLDAAQMAQAFAINAIGPALLMKHFLPLLPRQGTAVFATLSAKVGSIGDNRLGGWYSYRASKAALNQLVHTAAIELRRRAPQAICVALHPGTVHSALSQPFAKTGLDVRQPEVAAAQLLAVMADLKPEDSGGFFSFEGESLPW